MDTFKFVEPTQEAVFKDKNNIPFEEVDFNKIHCACPSSKQIPGKDKNQEYLGSTAEYECGRTEAGAPIYKEFRFQGPKMHTRFGISKMTDEKTGDTSYSIYTLLDQSKPELKDFRDFLEDLHDTMCEFIEKYANNLGKPDGYNKAVAKVSIGTLYKFKKDKITKVLHKDKDPFLYNKLKAGFEKTIFVGMDKKIIPWSNLYGDVIMEFVPVYTIGIYSGGMGLSFPMKMVEALVLYYRKDDVTSGQSSTIEKYKADYLEEYRKSFETLKLSIASSAESSSGPSTNESTLGELDINNKQAQSDSPSKPPSKTPIKNRTIARKLA